MQAPANSFQTTICSRIHPNKTLSERHLMAR